MKRLELPTELVGPWEHVLILTYGANIPFFEHALWSQFAPSCRNKIILADGRQFLEACTAYADSGLVRYINHRYVAEGIFCPHSAHAKLILLTNAEQGRLLVGSGNLSLQGYASGGEMFTRYEYNSDASETLPAFLTARELIEGILSRGYVGDVANRHIQLMFEATPWLYHAAGGASSPVRHNLAQSFLNQLKEEVNSEAVQEIWIHAPFLDREATALGRLLTELKPRKATLLVQLGSTSAEPAALQQALTNHKQLVVRPFELHSETAYVHAKFYLVKLTERAICLQGSLNLSVVAMLRADPHANIEIANLLVGKHDAFDELLDALDIGPETRQASTLDLVKPSTSTPTLTPAEGWVLTGGERQDIRLILTYQGILPDLSVASLIIAGRPFPFEITKHSASTLELRLGVEAADLLKQAVPLSVRWGDEDDVTNPIFVCDRAALEAELQVASEDKQLPRVGDLELEDEEFEQLLAELEASLVIDRKSVWQVVGGSLPAVDDEAERDEALRLDYPDVNYDLLRRHPKIQQYLRRGAGSQQSARTRLQMILSAITDHFHGLLDAPDIHPSVKVTPIEALTKEYEDEEEQQEQDQAAGRRRLTWEKRVRRILTNFIRRYIHGFGSPDFQEFAGFEVMAQNYVIFTHILWRLFAKDWVEEDFIVKSLLEIWSLFWGAQGQAGYFDALTDDQRAEVLSWVREYHSDAELLAAIYHGSVALRAWYTSLRDNEYTHDAEAFMEGRLALRDSWRHFLTHQPFNVTEDILEETWRIVASLIVYDPPRPESIISELIDLANYQTRDNFLALVEKEFNLSRGEVFFDHAKVRTSTSLDPVTVDCLVLQSPGPLEDADRAMELMRVWVKAEQLNYYRIVFPEADHSDLLILYEPSMSEGVYYRKDSREEVPFHSLSVEADAWAAELLRLRSVARKLDRKLTLPQRREMQQAVSRKSRKA